LVVLPSVPVVPPDEPPVALLALVVPPATLLVSVVPTDEPPIALLVPIVPAVALLLLLVEPPDADDPPALLVPPVAPPATLLVVPPAADEPPAPLAPPLRPPAPPAAPGPAPLLQAAPARAMIPNAKPTIGLRMVFPTTHYTAELAIASVGYSAPAMPKTIPAPLLAGAMVGITLAIALWVDSVRGKSSSMWRVKNHPAATPAAMPSPKDTAAPLGRGFLSAAAKYSPPTSSPPHSPPRSMKRTRAMEGET
jgi:hypothetical protein